MGVVFNNLGSEAGIKKLDEYLLSRSYISGYQASKDDLAVHAALAKPPSSEYVNASRWYNHIEALLRLTGVSGEGCGVTVDGSAPATTDSKTAVVDDDDDDSDVDLFGEETEEEKKAAEERAAAVKASGKKKESGKSSVLMDVKPWDDETDMKKLEEAVRSVQQEGLFWGASKLVAVGYGIKKLQIMMTIVDDLVSPDSIIEDYLTAEPANEYIQSCDIVAFNKICVSFKIEVESNFGIRFVCPRQKLKKPFDMSMNLFALGFESGIKTLDEYLITRSYITGYSASKDDLTVYAALEKVPSSHYVNALRWYNHIGALLRASGIGSVEASGKQNEHDNLSDMKKLEEGVGGLTIHEASPDLEKLEDRVGNLSIYGTS